MIKQFTIFLLTYCLLTPSFLFAGQSNIQAQTDAISAIPAEEVIFHKLKNVGVLENIISKLKKVPRNELDKLTTLVDDKNKKSELISTIKEILKNNGIDENSITDEIEAKIKDANLSELKQKVVSKLKGIGISDSLIEKLKNVPDSDLTKLETLIDDSDKRVELFNEIDSILEKNGISKSDTIIDEAKNQIEGGQLDKYRDELLEKLKNAGVSNSLLEKLKDYPTIRLKELADLIKDSKITPELRIKLDGLRDKLFEGIADFILTEDDRKALKILGFTDSEIDEMIHNPEDAASMISDKAATAIDERKEIIKNAATKDLLPATIANVLSLIMAALVAPIIAIPCWRKPSALVYVGTAGIFVAREIKTWGDYKIDIEAIEKVSNITNDFETLKKSVEGRIKPLWENMKAQIKILEEKRYLLKDPKENREQIQKEIVALKDIIKGIAMDIRDAIAGIFGDFKGFTDPQMESVRKLLEMSKSALKTTQKKADNAKFARNGYALASALALTEATIGFSDAGGACTGGKLKATNNLNLNNILISKACAADTDQLSKHNKTLEKMGIYVGATVGVTFLLGLWISSSKTVQKAVSNGYVRAAIFAASALLAHAVSVYYEKGIKQLQHVVDEVEFLYQTLLKKLNLIHGLKKYIPSKEQIEGIDVIIPDWNEMINKIEEHAPDIGYVTPPIKNKIAKKENFKFIKDAIAYLASIIISTAEASPCYTGVIEPRLNKKCSCKKQKNCKRFKLPDIRNQFVLNNLMPQLKTFKRGADNFYAGNEKTAQKHFNVLNSNYSRIQKINKHLQKKANIKRQKKGQSPINFNKRAKKIVDKYLKEAKKALNQLTPEQRQKLIGSPGGNLNNYLNGPKVATPQKKISPRRKQLQQKLRDRLMLYHLIKNHLEGKDLKKLARTKAFKDLKNSIKSDINIDDLSYDIYKNRNVSIFKIISRGYIRYKSKLNLAPQK